MSPHPSADRLSLGERRGLIALVIFFLILGIVTEFRWAGMERPKGDQGVYFRAAWAVRTGQDIYAITDHNGWHYHYPPLLAILMVPLASELGAEALPGMFPSAVSVAIWYALSLLFLVVAVHMLANALEATSDRPVERGSRRWWLLRLVPVAACLPPIALTLSRGQVNTLLLLLLCGTVVATLRGRHWQSGFWLAGAICLKVIPAFLLLFPLWRRDGRCLAGCFVGLVIGLGVIPAAVFGPDRTIAYYEEWTDAVILRGVSGRGDPTRDKELMETTATHSQSFVAIFHNTMYPDRRTRPNDAAPAVRLAAWLVGGVLTLVTLCCVGRRLRRGPETLLFFGSLVLLMFLLSPICHLHYLTGALPLVMGLVFVTWQKQGSATLNLGMVWLLAANAIATGLALFDAVDMVRDLGAAMYTMLGLWATASVLLWRITRTETKTTTEDGEMIRLAA